jgi:hypothetical protein
MKSLLIPAGLALAAVAGIFPSAAPAVVWRAPSRRYLACLRLTAGPDHRAEPTSCSRLRAIERSYAARRL